MVPPSCLLCCHLLQFLLQLVAERTRPSRSSEYVKLEWVSRVIVRPSSYHLPLIAVSCQWSKSFVVILTFINPLYCLYSSSLSFLVFVLLGISENVAQLTFSTSTVFLNSYLRLYLSLPFSCWLFDDGKKLCINCYHFILHHSISEIRCRSLFKAHSVRPTFVLSGTLSVPLFYFPMCRRVNDT